MTLQPTSFVHFLTISLLSSTEAVTNSPEPLPAWSIVSYTTFIFSLRASTRSTPTILNANFCEESISSRLTHAHIPTGPKPMTPIVNKQSAASRFWFRWELRPSPSFELRGYGRPVTIGRTLGWFNARKAANTPVGNISHMSNRELSAMFPLTSDVDQKSPALDRL